MPGNCESGPTPSLFQTHFLDLRENVGGSVSDLRKKKKGSSSSINVGGSLMNIGTKQIGIKKLAGSGNRQGENKETFIIKILCFSWSQAGQGWRKS